MSISDIYDNEFRKRNKDHFAAIVRLALSDDVITVEPELDFYEPEIPAFEPVYKEEIVEVEPEVIEMDNFQQTLEDDIEREIAELESEGDAMSMEDDIENEIAQLEDSTSSEEVDFDDPTNTSGKEVMGMILKKKSRNWNKNRIPTKGTQNPHLKMKYKSPIVMLGPTKWTTAQKVVNGKTYQVQVLVKDKR